MVAIFHKHITVSHTFDSCLTTSNLLQSTNGQFGLSGNQKQLNSMPISAQNFPIWLLKWHENVKKGPDTDIFVHFESSRGMS